MLGHVERRLGPEHREVSIPVRVRHGHRRGPTRNQARGPLWRRTSRGYYVPADAARTPEQRIVEAAVVCPDVAGVTGWGALRWMGAPWFDGISDGGRHERPVTVATCHADVRAQSGIDICQERLSPDELEEHHGLLLTSAARSVMFEMRYAPTIAAAVVTADMAAFSDLVSVQELAAYAAVHSGWTGIPRARLALGLVSESSWSPMETRLRLIWEVDAGLPRPLANRPVFDAGGHHLATPDLLDAETGLVVEYDGDVHLSRSQRTHDLRRERRMREAGLDCLTVVAADVARPERLAVQLQHARRRAGLLARGPRAWTIEAPAWWRGTDTVAQRRALTRSTSAVAS